MAKVSFKVSDIARSAGFDDVVANTKRQVRVYKTDGLKFATVEHDKATFPKNTVGVYMLDAHLTAGNKIIWPTKSVAELRADLVSDKVVTSQEAQYVRPGKFGAFFFETPAMEAARKAKAKK